jgi:pyruvate kinase
VSGAGHAELLQDLLALRSAIDKEEAAQRARIEAVLPRHRAGAANLAHYLGLRKRDLRKLQLRLAALGLSSLGRSEGHVRDTVNRLCGWLAGEPAADEPLDRARAETLLHENTRALFGPRPADRHVYIMVTAPEAAEATPAWADELLQAGADVLRINGAHESPAEWEQIAKVFKARAAALKRPGRIIVDLPGPKLRAEIRQLEDLVLHLPRRKDRMGRTVAPTEIDLKSIALPAPWQAGLRAGDILTLVDAGARERELRVKSKERAQCDRSLYLAGGLAVAWRRGDKVMGEGRLGAFPKAPRALHFSAGDTFLLNATGLCADAGTPALGLAEPALLSQVRAGERVVLDDGRIVAVVESASLEGLFCRVQRTARPQARLRSGKGVSFPDTPLSLPQFGPADEAALAFAAAHADGIGASFVSTPQDVARVVERVRPGFALILKLETRGALENLPAILFEALKHDPVGLMIARGDLAVELSFERLAEMQEELLWFGEACHLPVVWATQVLDSMAHSGLPTRAEVTDAAMAMRAECVMLNRGPHVAAAVRMLADIVRKMEAHQFKKRAIYRPLGLAKDVTQAAVSSR